MKKGRVTETLSRYKYPLLVIAVGCALLLLPTGSKNNTEAGMGSEESRMAQILEHSEGIGNAEVLLSDNGAVIVCDGADDAQVRLNIIEAVKAYTGLGCDRIQVLKSGQKSGGQNE